MSEGFTLNAAGTKWTCPKDPDAVLDYGHDFTEWLDGDTIVSKQVDVVAGAATVNSSSINGPRVIAWIAGGTAGETCAVRFRITTLAGRIDDRTFYLKIKER